MNIFKCLIQPFLNAIHNSAVKEPDHARGKPNAQRPSKETPTPSSTSEGQLPNSRFTARPPVLPPLIIEPPPTAAIAPPTPGGLTPPPTSRRGSDTSSYKSDDGSVSQPSPSRSNSNSKPSNLLKDQLRNARREWPKLSHKFFVPRSAQELLITESVVKTIIQAGHSTIEEGEAGKYATETCQSARQLFAILAYMKKGPEIRPLLEEGVSDKDLPLHRTAQGPFALQRRTGTPIRTLEKWSDKDQEKFDRIQWWMAAPFLEDKEHYELEDGAILPFVSFEPGDEPKVGGYSEVYPRRLHPAHHNFWERCKSEDVEPLVAIKKLHSPDYTEFQKEVTILRALGPKRHPHLISLLATFKHKHKYHLMFPWANSNLRKYWEDRPQPSFDEPTVMWSLKQMAGIASALLLIHNFRVTYPLSPSGPGGLRVPGGVKLSVGEGEEFFGRHGDIKPENILWFMKMIGINDENGVLQIADFGLGRFHGRDSRSGISPSKVVSSPTYEPPECKLHKPVSRSYDIWSLGCLYLEFITWLLKGAKEIDNFGDFRGRPSSIGISEDNFYTIIKTDDEPEAIVREEVVDWVNQLHQHEKCSKLIHDLLDLTVKKLLVVDSKERASAKALSQQLEEYLQKAKEDKQYLLAPAPWPKPPSPTLDSRKTPKKSVTFERKAVTAVKKWPGPSMDLVLRDAGTPGFVPRNPPGRSQSG